MHCDRNGGPAVATPTVKEKKLDLHAAAIFEVQATQRISEIEGVHKKG
jgi:hypothetical protein